MPDFNNIETAWACASSFYFERAVKGSKGDLYVVHWGRLPEARILETGEQHGWQCTCQGYKFRGTCKHIREVEPQRCAWNAEMGPTAECAHDADGSPVCPECGGQVRAVRVVV